MGFDGKTTGRRARAKPEFHLRFLSKSYLRRTQVDSGLEQGSGKRCGERSQAQKKKGPGLSGIQFSFLIGDCFSPRACHFSHSGFITDTSWSPCPLSERGSVVVNSPGEYWGYWRGPRCRRKCPRSRPISKTFPGSP